MRTPNEFALTIWAIGKQPRLPITEDRYNALDAARQTQLAVLQIEEKFDLVITNYEEFESELVNLAVRHMIRRNLPWARMSADRLLLNRRLANLLSTCRLYRDQVKHDLGAPPLSIETTTAERLFSIEYDASLGFRVMESVRNLLQHRSIPVTGITYSGRRQGVLSAFSIDLKLDLDVLASQGFKATVLEELQALPSAKIDLILFVREYVQGLAKVHSAIRELIKASVVEADLLIGQALSDWKATGHPQVGLSAAKFYEDRTGDGEIRISENLRERRDELATANQSLERLSLRCVTSARPEEAYSVKDSVQNAT